MRLREGVSRALSCEASRQACRTRQDPGRLSRIVPRHWGHLWFSLRDGIAFLLARLQDELSSLRPFPGRSGCSRTRSRAWASYALGGPGPDALEHRHLLASAVIQGYAYPDLNQGGIRVSADPALAGVTVTPQDAAGNIVATTTASVGSSGVAPRLVVAPQTQTETLTFPVDGNTRTDWNSSGTVPQFDPGLGTLTSVEITRTDNTSIHSTITVTNLDAAPQTIDETFGGVLTVTGPGGINLVASPTQAMSTVAQPGVPQTNDVTLNPPPETQVLTDPAQLALFTGTGTVTFNASAVGTSTAVGPGNFSKLILTDATAQIQVVYHYTSASLSGIKYFDSNRNGVRDPGEYGIAHVAITLTGINDLGQAVRLTTETAADGSYSFTGLRPGTYTLTETSPLVFRTGQSQIGTSGGVARRGQIGSIVLTVGEQGVGNNFGELARPGCKLYCFAAHATRGTPPKVVPGPLIHYYLPTLAARLDATRSLNRARLHG
jgi:hypothetical protein